MKKNIKLRTVTIIALALGLLALASISFAHGGYGYGMMDGYGYGMMGYGPGAAHTQTSLTADQQQKLTAVKEKYGDQLKQLQQAIDQKTDEYRSARANDSTTVGSLKQLDAQIGDLQQQYQALLNKANTESGGLLATTSRPWYGCYDNDDHGQHHWGMMGERGYHMGYGHMSDDDDTGSLWN